jgi:thiosulfate/3-mercaptopyruvate sulfurtransferase
VQSLTAQDIISANDLAKISKDENVTIISARAPADYKKVHISGAVNIDHKSLYAEQSMLKPTSGIAKILGDAGISEKNQLVIYDDGSAKYAGRMYWILKYMGASNVKVLDAGMKGWRVARKPVTKNPTQITSVTFTPKVNANIIATMDQVNRAIAGSTAILVDVRSPEEFEGTAASNLRKGHIPSAINLEYKNVLNPDGTLKSKDELAQLFSSAGIPGSKEVILYCESSVRAGIVYLALTSSLGYKKVKVYDGAFIEWQDKTSNKVDTD